MPLPLLHGLAAIEWPKLAIKELTRKLSTATLGSVEENPSHSYDLFSDTAFWTKFVN
jgi:hypothetical protein